MVFKQISLQSISPLWQINKQKKRAFFMQISQLKDYVRNAFIPEVGEGVK